MLQQHLWQEIIKDLTIMGSTEFSKTEVKRLGQISNEGSQCGIVYDTSGVYISLCAGTHGWCNGYILVDENGTDTLSR